MELKQAGKRTYYIEHGTNIGIYLIGDNRICIIDTGSKGDGEKIDEIITAQGWIPEYIINTHTHIDHVGGNSYLMNKYGIPAYCADKDKPFAEYSELEAAYMFGGAPCERLRKVFSHPGKLGFKSIEEETPEGMEWIYLPGHTFAMIGVKTLDDIWFTGDAYLSRGYIKKHSFGYLCDVDGYLGTLEMLPDIKGKMFIPSHGTPEEEITEICELNGENVNNIADNIKDICSDYASIDEILKGMYERYTMKPSITQHALLASTVKCYLTYMQDRGVLECKFIDNVMVWKCF